MRVLFTGSSSFSGYWFIEELLKQGCEVTAIYQKSFQDYEGIRKLRVEKLQERAHQVFGCSFGSDPFFELIENEHFDILCHHAADVTDYRSPGFNYLQAVKSNTYNIEKVLKVFAEKGCSRIHLTGSVFEQNEGESAEPLLPVSPYGLSKGLTSDIFQYFTAKAGLEFSKFVIPNPFGAFEDRKFTSYLMDCWKNQQVAEVGTPKYVRDNIPVDLLAQSYVASLLEKRPYSSPKGYSETQGEFTQRVSKEVAKRTGLPCQFSLCEQSEFNEPLVRVNKEPVAQGSWDEAKFWDAFVRFYHE